jgi:hypothetical protein
MSNRNPSNSTGPRPRPKPRITRPLETESTQAISSATRTGSCQGSTITMVPSLNALVRPAM